MSKPLNTLLSSLALSAGLAASVQAADLPPPAPADTTAQGCRLIVTDATKKQYPEGLLDFAAKNCWAGQATDIVVIGKDDVLQVNRSHLMLSPRIIDLARGNLLNLLPEDLRTRFTAIESTDQQAILKDILHASLSSENSVAFKYRFTGQNGQPNKDVFVTVIDDIPHLNDHMALIAGVYLGSYINPELYYSLTDEKSTHAKTLAHESGHSVQNDGLKVITNNKIDIVRSLPRTDLSRMKAETGADRIGNTYIDQAIKAGIKVSQHTSGVDHGLRALSAYFSYGVDVPRGADDYRKAYANIYVANPNPLPWHATSAGLLTKEQPDPAQQAEGVLEFRAAINRTLGEMFYDAASKQTYQFSPDIEEQFRRELDFCDSIADELPDEMKAKDAPAPLNAATLVGNCIAHDTYMRGFAVNALIELEDQNYVPKNDYAKTYMNEFSQVLRASFVTAQFLHPAAHYYIDYQREHMKNAEVQARWDKLFVDQGLMKLEPRTPTPVPAPAPAPAPGGTK